MYAGFTMLSNNLAPTTKANSAPKEISRWAEAAPPGRMKTCCESFHGEKRHHGQQHDYGGIQAADAQLWESAATQRAASPNDHCRCVAGAVNIEGTRCLHHERDLLRQFYVQDRKTDFASRKKSIKGQRSAARSSKKKMAARPLRFAVDYFSGKNKRFS